MATGAEWPLQLDHARLCAESRSTYRTVEPAGGPPHHQSGLNGTEPSFKLVTGVSTGSMIAPFAFLGRAYHDRLCKLYTTITPADILKARGLTAVLTRDALADTDPLYRLISRYVDEQMLADIATEYGKGRLLLIGTTSLDFQRPVIWNIGAIAAKGGPQAVELVRKILLASAAIPGAFPPVMIRVEAGGEQYQEMNVDGGAVAQTFLYPANLRDRIDPRSPSFARDRHAYIIRNGRLDPEWASVDRGFLSITGRAIATMIHYSGYNDVFRIYAITKRDGVDYNLAYIKPTSPWKNTKNSIRSICSNCSTTAMSRAGRDIVGAKRLPCSRARSDAVRSLYSAKKRAGLELHVDRRTRIKDDLSGSLRHSRAPSLLRSSVCRPVAPRNGAHTPAASGR